MNTCKFIIFHFTFLDLLHSKSLVNPPSPYFKWAVGPSKNWITWGVRNFLLERDDEHEKGGVDVEMGGCNFFYNFIVKFNRIYIFRSSVFWVSHARFSSQFSSKSCAKTWYHLNISDPFWKSTNILTALFKLIQNTQKSIWTIFFLSAKAKCFLVLKRF